MVGVTGSIPVAPTTLQIRTVLAFATGIELI